MGKQTRIVTDEMRAAQKKYRASAKGKEAARRARDKYRGMDAEQCRARAQWREEQRRETRRARIMLGLPPDVPQWTRADATVIDSAAGRATKNGEPKKGRALRVFDEVATAERLRPSYIAAALALEDLQNDLGL